MGRLGFSSVALMILLIRLGLGLVVGLSNGVG